METKIIQYENPILRQVAKDVPVNEISSTKIKKVIQSLKAALKDEEDGVAIAAPQIGESLRIFIVSGRILWFMANGPDALKPQKYPEDVVFINPKFIKLSKDKEWLEEGCLSVRYLYGKIRRSKKVTIKAYDQNGRLFQRGASGLLAQIFQHEYDHLEGKLFIDKAKDIQNLPPEKHS
jgi:peptide deformylase